MLVMFHEGTDGQLPTAGLDRFDNFFMTHMTFHPFEQADAGGPVDDRGVVARLPATKIAFLESAGAAGCRSGCTGGMSTGCIGRTRCCGLMTDPTDRFRWQWLHLKTRTKRQPAAGGRFHWRGDWPLLGVGTIRTGMRSSPARSKNCGAPWRGLEARLRNARSEGDNARRLMNLPW